MYYRHHYQAFSVDKSLKYIYKLKELKLLVNTLKTCFNKENSYKVFIKLSLKFLVRIVKHFNKILKCFTFVQADRCHLKIKTLHSLHNDNDRPEQR